MTDHHNSQGPRPLIQVSKMLRDRGYPANETYQRRVAGLDPRKLGMLTHKCVLVSKWQKVENTDIGKLSISRECYGEGE